MNYFTESRDNIFVAAHRGLSAVYPENTLLAFRKALEVGADQLETDVRISADGRLVLMHDATVDRTTDGTGRVDEKTFEELEALDAGVKKGFPGERIPEFTEFMELVKDHPTVTLDVELKEYPTEGHEEISYSVCDRVLRIIDDYGFADRVVINTFSGALHEYIRKKFGGKYRRHLYYPVSYLGELTEDPYSFPDAFCCCMFRREKVRGEMNIADPEEFAEMAARGIEPWAGAAVKDAAGVDRAIAAGAVLITCNNADEILSLLRERGKHK